jgi:hypothetical protein
MTNFTLSFVMVFTIENVFKDFMLKENLNRKVAAYPFFQLQIYAAVSQNTWDILRKLT